MRQKQTPARSHGSAPSKLPSVRTDPGYQEALDRHDVALEDLGASTEPHDSDEHYRLTVVADAAAEAVTAAVDAWVARQIATAVKERPAEAPLLYVPVPEEDVQRYLIDDLGNDEEIRGSGWVLGEIERGHMVICPVCRFVNRAHARCCVCESVSDRKRGSFLEGTEPDLCLDGKKDIKVALQEARATRCAQLEAELLEATNGADLLFTEATINAIDRVRDKSKL